MIEDDFEAGAIAPAAEAVDAPVDTDAAPVDTELGQEPAASEASLSDDTAPDDTAPASFPSVDDFGWDDWDGARDALPEELRPWTEKFEAFYNTRAETKYERLRNEAEESNKIYEALLAGQEDPRLAQFQEQITQLTSSNEEAKAYAESVLQQHEAYVKNVEAAIEQEADAYARDFADSNPDLFNDESLATTFADLLEESWGLEAAAEAARLPAAALEVAKKAKADGVPDSYALKLARGTKMRSPQPRPGAQITSGATTPSRSPEQVETVNTGAMSLKDWRSHVARNALNKTKRRA